MSAPSFNSSKFPGNKRGSVELGKRMSASTGSAGIMGGNHVVKLDDISEDGQKKQRPVRSYTTAIQASERTLEKGQQRNHEATRNLLKVFLAIILASGLLATFGAVFYMTTTDGSKVEGSSWRTKNDDPVAVSLATARVSLDVQFDALKEEGTRRRLSGEDTSDIHDSPQCANLKNTLSKMRKIHVEGSKGEVFSCNVGGTMLDCQGMTSSVTCETGEVLAYAPDASRRLGHIVHPEGETMHTLMAKPELHPHGRKLWFWSFVLSLFGISEVEADVEETFESRPKEKINCVTSAWSDYSTCSYNYGFDGSYIDDNYNWDYCLKSRTRTIETHPEHGGSSCGALSQTSTCACIDDMDGRITAGEECDDGNIQNGDGCSSTGAIEEGFECESEGGSPSGSSRWVYEPSQCHGGYNNGVVDFGEECDDGNTVDGDGCHDGKRDPLYLCPTAGQPCTCARVRRDWNTLTTAEKDLYTDAINDLKKSGVYDKFVHVHGLDANKEYAHGTGGFLPWHRWYLLQFEDALRAQAPSDPSNDYTCLTIPYWDWGEEADLCAQKGGCRTLDEESDIVKHFGGAGSSSTTLSYSDQSEWNSDESKLSPGDSPVGTFGSSAQDPNDSDDDPNTGCVTSGPFANWIVPVMPTHPAKTCLSRSRSLSSSGTEGFTSAADMIETMISYDYYGAYGGFRSRLEGLPHANPHNLLGGHIRTFVSPADPLFFSHHTYVDKLWAMWQDCHDHEDATEAMLKTSTTYYNHVFDKDPDNLMNEATAIQRGLFDGLEGALPFYAVDGSVSPGPTCITGALGSPPAPTAHTCPQCVAFYDEWCTGSFSIEDGNMVNFVGNWDDTCTSVCSGQCASYCGTPPATQHASKFFGAASGLFADAAEGVQGSAINPLNMHNIKDPRLYYSYEPDEFDKKIVQARLGNSCNLGHFMWHLEGLEDSSRRLHFERGTERRKLSAGASGNLDLIHDYIEKTLNSSLEESIFIDDKSKELGAITEVVKKECALLYSKNPIDTKSGAMNPNLAKDNTFWRKWRMAKDFEAGATQGKCAKILA